MNGLTRTVICDEVTTTFEEWGDGPPLILAHGGGADRGMWRGLAPLLADRFRVIAYDQRDSGGTVNPATPYTMAHLGRDLGDLVEALGFRRAHVFGTSFGGLVAQNAALERPERIDRLMLSVTYPGVAGRVPVNPAFLALAARARNDPGSREEHQQMFVSRRGRERDWPRLQRVLAEAMVTRPPEAHARRGEAVQSHDTLGRLADIRARTLVLAAEEDEIVPLEESRALADGIAGAQFQLLPGAGHAWTLEDPARAARVIAEFLGAP